MDSYFFGVDNNKRWHCIFEKHGFSVIPTVPLWPTRPTALMFYARATWEVLWKIFTYVSLSAVTTIQWGKCHYRCHFTDEKTEIRSKLLRLFKMRLWALSKDVLISKIGVFITFMRLIWKHWRLSVKKHCKKHFIPSAAPGLSCSTGTLHLRCSRRNLQLRHVGSWPGTEPRLPALGTWSPSHWVTREVSPKEPVLIFFVFCLGNLQTMQSAKFRGKGFLVTTL